jgi:hypothetical protein
MEEEEGVTALSSAGTRRRVASLAMVMRGRKA